MKVYKLYVQNSFMEPVFVGKYASVEQLIVALIAALAEHKHVEIEAVEEKAE